MLQTVTNEILITVHYQTVRIATIDDAFILCRTLIESKCVRHCWRMIEAPKHQT